MKKLFAILAAGIIALLSFNSCEMLDSEFDNTSCEVFLTCFYAGGLPTASVQQTYDLEGRLRDRDIEAIFYELSEDVQPGFMSAVMEIDFYDWMGGYDYTRAYDFWWESVDLITAEGYYAWEERHE